MIIMTHEKQQRQLNRQGLSLVEVMISTLLVGLVLVSSLTCLGGAIQGQSTTSDSARGAQLARELMTEIVNTNYVDDGPSPVFGIEIGEASLNRSAFDDVDDFNTWSASPPEDLAGTPIINTTGWQRTVVVELVNLTDPETTSISDQGLKKITITVLRNGQLISRLVALRSEEYSIP